MHSRISRLLATAALVAGLAANLTSPAQAGKADDTLTIAMTQELSSLDGYFNSAGEMSIFKQLVWDNLIFYDNTDDQIYPAIAESYEYVPGEKMVFKIRKGIKWHDGTDLTIDDVLYTLNFVSKKENGVNNQASVNWIKSVEKLDEDTVQVNLVGPDPGALTYIARRIVIYQKGAFEREGGIDEHPIGTGPYKVVSVETGGTIKLERFDDHFAGSPKGKAKIKNVVWRTIPDKGTQIAELISGGVDWIQKVESDQAEQLAAMPNLTVESVPTHRINYMLFDSAGGAGEGPMQNVKVRQAIAYAIDREAIVTSLVGGQSKVIDQFCYPGHFGCTEDVAHYEYNPQKAKELLAEAGYPDGFNLTIVTWRDRPVAEAIIGYLQEVGIKVDFQYLKVSAVVERWGKFPIIIGSRGLSYHDVSAMGLTFFDLEPDDMAQDEELTGWLRAGDRGTDDEARKEVYAKALKRIAERVYALPLYTYSATFAYNANLEMPKSTDEVPQFYLATWKD